jgi:hypothetical protein
MAHLPQVAPTASAPGAAPSGIRVLALAADPASTITEIRLSAPLAPLVSEGRVALRLLPWHAAGLPELEDCAVVIGQRPLTARHLRLLQAAHERGLAVIVEIDDLLTQPAPHLLSRGVLQRQAPWVTRALDEADWISVSTERLGLALAAPGRRSHLVPNHAWPQAGLAGPAGPGAATAPGDGPASVLLAASDAVATGAAFEALRRLQAERGGALRIVAIGPVAESARAAGLVVEARPVMPRDRFLALAATLPRAVAVIPIDDSAFSACKSAVKWFDFAAAGLPTLMSDRPPYRDVVEHGQTGWLVADDAEAWACALALALDDAALRERVAANARERVRARHAIAHSTAAWRALLEEAAAAQAAGAVRRRRAAWHRPLTAPLDAWLAALRRANRERLARRQGR